MLIDIHTLLGKPFYENKDILIYNLDCIKGMEVINNRIFNLVITSPPYNIGKEYEKPLSTKEYINWSKEWLSYIPRLLNNNGSFWLNLGYISMKNKAKALPLTYLLWDKVDMFLIQEIIWNYGAGVAGKKFLSPRNEKWLWYVNNENAYTFNLDDIRDPNVKYPNQKKNGKLRCNTIGKNPSDVWQIAKVTSGKNRSSKERMNHPAQYPTDLIDRIVKGFSNEGDIILDPFMGSGSTAISALRHGRKVVGFEINQEYCKIIADRVDAFYFDKKQEEAQQTLTLI